MFLNSRDKSHDLLFYETLERRCELTSVERSWSKTFHKGLKENAYTMKFLKMSATMLF